VYGLCFFNYYLLFYNCIFAIVFWSYFCGDVLYMYVGVCFDVCRENKKKKKT
jgi:hypothetical protein